MIPLKRLLVRTILLRERSEGAKQFVTFRRRQRLSHRLLKSRTTRRGRRSILPQAVEVLTGMKIKALGTTLTWAALMMLVLAFNVNP
mmetsp:Transcript_3964/g.7263  ORF Transcript_3964/g.7263 Transcript_3964/m.7263 type:complete len:87 (-) Transcript_3964:433-693(-)